MVYLAIGSIVGIIMGITGAGGALIAIPLFITLLDTTLKEATVLSLIAVVFGTAVNLFGLMSRIDKRVTIPLSLAGIVTNFISLPLKSNVSDVVIVGLLAFLGIYSVVSVWTKHKETGLVGDAHHLFKALLAGSLLGLITTLTGLGGGVVLIPILLRFFGKSYDAAVPTSLATIFLISLSAFALQSTTALRLLTPQQLIGIGGGAIVASFTLKRFLTRMKQDSVLKTRKIIFTMVAVYSIMSVIIKAL